MKPTSVLSVGATIFFDDDEGERTSVAIKPGDTIDVTITTDAIPTTMTYSGATLIDIIGRPRRIERGSSRCFDGVPMVMFDPDGNGKWGTITETTEVQSLVLDVPIPTEDEEAEPATEKRIVHIDQVVSIAAGD